MNDTERVNTNLRHTIQTTNSYYRNEITNLIQPRHGQLMWWRNRRRRSRHSHSCLSFHVPMPPNGQVEGAFVFKLPILLTESARLAAKVDATITTRSLLEIVLASKFGSVKARVETAPCVSSKHEYDHVHRPAHTTRRSSSVYNLGDASKGNTWTPASQAT